MYLTEPDMFDLAGWRQRLADLLSDPEASETMIFQARHQVATLEQRENRAHEQRAARAR